MTQIIDNNKYCTNCGSNIDSKAVICPKCGVPQPGIKQSSIKNEITAAALSFLIVGLGQIYNGQIGKGFLFIFIQIFNSLLIWIGIGLITVPLFWIYQIWDAYNEAKKINEEY